MERLTQRLRTGEVLMASTYEEKYTEQEWISVLQDRLAAYEDTGLEPEEINDLASVREISPEAEYAINKHADNIIERLDKLLRQTDDDARLRELAEADRAGRLVVLPCKVGDGLWTFCSHPVEQVYSFTVTDISTLNGRTMLNTSRCGVIDARDVGKTVFLNREEAAKALEATKDVK